MLECKQIDYSWSCSGRNHFIILVVYQAALIEMKYLQNEEFYIRLRHNFQLIRLLQECTKYKSLFYSISLEIFVRVRGKNGRK